MAWKDNQNRWLTVGLFKETASQKKWVQYTLEEAKQLYLASEDPTGYDFATTCLGGWQHWLAIKESSTLEGIIAGWEEELEVKLRSKGLKQIALLAKCNKGYQAAKFMAEGSWKPKELGRPTKEKIQRESRIKSKMYDEFTSNVHEFKRK